LRSSPAGGLPSAASSSIRALLGPTNTGKTHRAIEQMLQHETGMIGLPLRLLAREVYDRVTARVGEAAVALVTGEEKRVPAHPRYWICTVEAMPADREVDFFAVDEIQLAGHRERGHVFTDRLLHGRGREETWFLGADTMRPLIERLVPTAVLEGRPRLSTLSGIGSVPMGALPPRTAVVAFSAPRVYELAERLRAKRGGAAVVLGALSPRARNAQVALYQSGEVDYMVATDAIGMGLNMDLDCVAFADTRKFDGRKARELEEAELAQIAGRAGRHHNDGRFATLAPLPPLSLAVTRAIERHRFPVQERIYWRSRDLDTRSLPALLTSLKRRPFAACLELVDDAEDVRALARLAQDEEVIARTRTAAQVALLWEVCQIPDFRQLQLDDHFQLLRAVYLQLSTGRARLDTDWVAEHVERLDQVQGDMDTLLARMAFIRTWTFITHRTHWLDDAAAWQGRARAIEDRLSDALHEQLVRRFVEGGRGGRRRSTTRPRARTEGAAARSLADQLREKVLGDDGDLAAAGPSAGPEETLRWVDEVVDSSHDRFGIDERARIVWLAEGRPIARLGPGIDLLRPEVTLTVPEALGAGARLRLQRRLVAWSRDLVADLVSPLRPEGGDGLSAAARGLLYQLERHLGTVRARDAREQLALLSPADRAALKGLGVRIGRHVVFVPAMLTARALVTRKALCTASLGRGARIEAPVEGAPSLEVRPDLAPGLYTALGYPVFAGRAIRADVAETAADRLLNGAPPDEVARRLGCGAGEIPALREAFARSAGPRRRGRGRRR
jgi:ATP-dependent RNA helicase SUPV3L1/SUV3